MAVWNFKKNYETQPPQKTVEANSAESHINQLIAAENSNLEKHYLSIGRKYVQLHETDYEEDFSGDMDAIAASRKKLDDYSLQMQIVMGVIICTGCGNKAPAGSVFCNMCGSRLPVINYDAYEICESCGILKEKAQDSCPGCGHRKQEPTTSLIHCPECGEYIGSDNLFCPICGNTLNVTMPPDLPVTHRCPNPACGAVMSSEMLFCTECGTKMR